MPGELGLSGYLVVVSTFTGIDIGYPLFKRRYRTTVLQTIYEGKLELDAKRNE